MPADIGSLLDALAARTARLDSAPDASRPVLLPSCHGTRRQPNLTALLALLLRRYEVPVVVHGLEAAECLPPDDEGGAAGGAPPTPVSSFDVFRELGVEPTASLAGAQAALSRNLLALVPLALLAPDLARQLAGDGRRRPPAHASTLAKLVDPFAGRGYRVIGLAPADDRRGLREHLAASRADALVFDGTEGEPFVLPGSEASLESFCGGRAASCVEPDAGARRREPPLPPAGDVRATATWIADALAGRQSVPSSIVVQLGCCLAGARRLDRVA